MPKPRSKPTGNALAWTPDDIARLAEVTPEDIAAAKSHAARLMPKRARPLLNAKRKGKQ